MANVKSIINMYNKEVITEKKTVTTSEFRNYHGKIYYGASEGTFNSDMETIRNHSIMKSIGEIQNVRRNTCDLTLFYLKYMFFFL